MASSAKGNRAIGIVIRLPVNITKKEEWVIATCPALDVNTQGRSCAEARKNMEEALSLFLESCLERGVLNEVLRGAGFTKVESPVQNGPQQDSGSFVEVPLSLLRGKKADRSAKCPV